MNFEDLAKMARDMQLRFEQLQPIIDLGNRQVQEIGKTMNNLFKQIDFSALEEAINESHGVIVERTEEMARQNLFLNLDMLDDMTFSEIESKFTPEWVMDWMDRNLEERLNLLAKDSNCFGETTILLKQSYTAYLREDYVIAFLSLYPVIDSYVSHWYSSEDGKVEIRTGKIRSLEHGDKKELMKSHQSFKRSLEADKSTAFDILFASHAFNAFSKMYSGTGHYGFKRHHTLHGSLAYSQITRLDYIKLFFFLHALYQMQEIPKNEYLISKPLNKEK